MEVIYINSLYRVRNRTVKMQSTINKIENNLKDEMPRFLYKVNFRLLEVSLT